MDVAKASTFRLISGAWDTELLAACRGGPGPLRIVCPFIKKVTLARLFAASRGSHVEVITRFDLNCFNQGVSDLEALKMVLDAGGAVRGVKGLHAKVYLFGSETVIATSANVTEAAFRRNHEFGFLASDPNVVAACQHYFDDLWRRAGTNLSQTRISSWARQLEAHQRKGGGVTRPNTLADYGADAGDRSPLTFPSDSPPPEIQAFVKFFGQGSNRAPADMVIADIVAESGCNWACTYPPSKPPRQVEDGDLIYMARITHDDIMIFGKAIGRRHRDYEDIATAADIKRRPWKARWPRYVRVHDARFIDARLEDGISFYEMMNALGSDSFDSTQQNAKARSGNRDPFASYFRKAHMMLTPQSREWIETRLNAAILRHGEVDLTPSRYRPPAD